jgi:hypothetical protein
MGQLRHQGRHQLTCQASGEPDPASGGAASRAFQRDRARADGLQYQGDNDRISRQASVAHHMPGTNRLNRHVDRASQTRRVRRQDHFVIGGPQRQPTRPARHCGVIQLGQQRITRHQLLARCRTRAWQDPGSVCGESRPMERRAQGDHAARLVTPVVLSRPHQHDHTTSRVADHINRWRSISQRPLNRCIEHSCVSDQTAGPTARQAHHAGAPPGRPDPGSKHAQRSSLTAIARDEQHRAQPVLRRVTPGKTRSIASREGHDTSGDCPGYRDDRQPGSKQPPWPGQATKAHTQPV